MVNLDRTDGPDFASRAGWATSAAHLQIRGERLRESSGTR